MGATSELGVALVGIAKIGVRRGLRVDRVAAAVRRRTHAITWFIPYRVALGLLLIGLLATGVMAPT